MTSAIRSRAFAGLAVAVALSGCAPETSTKEGAVRPERSAAALSYSRGSTDEAANAEFVALIDSNTDSGDTGYYRNVECAAALQGAIARAQGQLSGDDPRVTAFREAIQIFRERAVNLGEQAGYSRRRVLNEIANAHGPDDERDQDTAHRQAQQSVLCLYQLS